MPDDVAAGTARARRVCGLVAAVAVAMSLGWSPAPAVAAPGVSAGVSGPAQVHVPDNATFTITVTNSGTEPLDGVSIKITFPPLPTILGIGASSCAGDGAGSIVCVLGTLAPGASVAVPVTVGTTTAGALHHSYTVTASSAPVSADGTYDLEVLPPVSVPPTPVTDIDVAVSAASPTGGLHATHVVTVRNLGPADAYAVTAAEVMSAGEQVVSLTLSQGSCAPDTTADSKVILRCVLGDLRAGASATMTVGTRMPPNPSGDVHQAGALPDSTTYDPVGANNTAGGTATWSGRYWLCHVCGGVLLPTGYLLPGSDGFRVLDDDTVVLSDGSVIRRDGTVAIANGDLMLPDGSLVPGGARGQSGQPATGTQAGTAGSPSGPTTPASPSQLPVATPPVPRRRVAASMGAVTVAVVGKARVVRVHLTLQGGGAGALVTLRPLGSLIPTSTVRRQLGAGTSTVTLRVPAGARPRSYRLVARVTPAAGTPTTITRTVVLPPA